MAQAPTITSFSPTNAAANETVTITGTNFSSITAVRFGGTNAVSYNVVSTTTITAVVGAGTSGSVTVSKTGFSDATRSGFTFSSIPTVTRMITDFGGYWSTNTTSNSPVYPDDSHHLLGFGYGSTVYSTGVNDAALSDHAVAYTAATFKALPAIMAGTTSGSSLYIAAASKIDGNASAGLYTHPNIKDMTIQSVLSDGINGLDIGTGYTNLPVGATSNFNIYGIQLSKAIDNEPDLVITQIADPSTSAFDTYRFLDASNNVVGTSLQIDLSKLSPLGTYRLDLFGVPTGVPFANAKPVSIATGNINTTRQLRLMAFKLSDFGINAGNYSLVKRLQVIPSGVTDMAFVAYNTTTINVPPSIAQNLAASSTAICNPGGGNAHLAVNATSASGGTLSYSWEVSTDGGSTWTTVTDGGIYTGAATDALNVSSATVGYKYRATVTESGTGYSSVSPEFTITAIANTALAGTLNPTGFSNCLNAASGTTTLSVSPTGGTGSYSYQWSQAATAAGPYTDIPGATYNSFSPDVTTAGTVYYKVLIRSGCVSNLSTEAQVIIAGDAISSVTNGSRCNTGSVALSATATGGTVNWYTAPTGGTSVATGNTYNTPTISATTTYYAGTVSGSCSSVREPVVATIVNTISLSSSNFGITNATNICAGSGSVVSLASSALIDGDYTVTYTISGANTISGGTATVTISSGSGNFTTANLFNAGSNNITITGIQVGGCTVTPSSGNTGSFNVNAGSPLVSNFTVTVSDGCNTQGSIATVQSTTLATGTYIVTFDISGSNTATGQTAQMNFTAGTPGSGSFSLPALPNTGSNTITVTAVALLSAPDCASALVAGSPAFASSLAATADAGPPKVMCASDGTVNISLGASADNYTTLVWSTSNGTGSFTNNNTADALSNTLYTVSAADITRGWAYMTLTATPASGCAPVSQTVTLTINAAVSGGTVTASQVIPSGTIPADITLSGHSGTVLKWQSSTDPAFTSPTDIAVTSTTLAGSVIGPLTTTTYFRAVVQSGSCNPVYSSQVVITVTSLPVKLVSFSYKCEDAGVLLQWITSQEINNDHFVLERSENAQVWTTVATINGAGNSNSLLTYQYRDLAAKGRSYFYRLKQVDTDNRYEYSDVIKASCGRTKASFILSPNPATVTLTLGGLPLKGAVRITDAKGSQVYLMSAYTGSTLSVDLRKFAAGTYYVTVFADGIAETQSFIKQ
ncbi:MAG: IPT/TIG domain-containing protein [Ferruginibacter sp.]